MLNLCDDEMSSNAFLIDTFFEANGDHNKEDICVKTCSFIHRLFQWETLAHHLAFKGDR